MLTLNKWKNLDMTETISINGVEADVKQRGSSKAAAKQVVPILTGSSLDWFKLTESARFVLNDVIVRSSKALAKEQAKLKPNNHRIKRFESLIANAAESSRNSANFETKERMVEILTEYGKINIK
jgi:hypothetical protein